jgi:hypothetical protein
MALRHNGDELSKHGLADLVDPVQVLDHIQRRCGPGQGDGIQQGCQPAPTRIGGDGRRRGVGVADSEQVVQQQQVVGVGVGDAGPHLRPARVLVEVAHPEHPAQQPRHQMKRDLPGMGFGGDGEHLDAAAGSQRHGLARDAALADTGWPNHPDHTAGTVDRPFKGAGDGVHLPGAPDQGRLAPAEPHPLSSGPQQPARG